MVDDKSKYKECKKKYNRLLREVHTAYFSSMVSENSQDPRSLFKIIDSLLNKKKSSPLPENVPEAVLAEEFSNFFVNKVNLIHENLELLQPLVEHTTTYQKRYEIPLSCFSVVSEDDVTKVLLKSPKKSCILDPLPTWLLLKCKSPILPILSNIINMSISLSHIPNTLKSAMILPLLKSCNLSLIYKNYRPVSNLKFISKVLERIIAVQLQDHLLQNNILEPFQSAYRCGYSTETALVRVQNDILNAMDKQQV